MSVRAKWRVMTGLAFTITAYALAVLFVPNLRPPFLQDRVARVPLAVYGHLAASAVALAIGPFQLDSTLRRRRIGMHRWLGRVYLTSVVVGGLSGFRLAILSQGGVMAHAGFAVLAALWVLTAARAFQRIRMRDQANHRRWIIRNYSLTFAAVTLRVYLTAALALGIPFELAYPVISWLCWVPNLIIAEWRLLREPRTAIHIPAAV